MRYGLIFSLILGIGITARASDTLQVHSFLHAGPYEVQRPHLVDTLGTDGKPFDMKSFLDVPLSFESLRGTGTVSSISSSQDAVHLLGFNVECSGFAKVDVLVEGLDSYALFVDGNKSAGSGVALDPGTHNFVIKCLTVEGKDNQPVAKIVCKKGAPVTVRTDARRLYSLDLNTQGESCGGVSVSAGGNLLALTHANVAKDGRATSYTEIINLKNNSSISRSEHRITWMPEGDSYYYTRPTVSGRELVTLNPLTGETSVICRDLPEGKFSVVPGGRYLVFTLEKKGPSEGDVHQILVPDDRQPGWRDRSYVARYDIGTGLMQPLTFGYHNSWLSDVSQDGSKILFMSSRDVLTSRPTTLYSIYVMDLHTLETSIVVEDDGFVTSAQFSPEADRVLVTGSPEAFNGIGRTTPAGRVPSMYDYQLYIVDIKGTSVTPLTKSFNPCIKNVAWNCYDGMIYFSAEVKDCVKLYKCMPANGRIESIPDMEDNEKSFDLASRAPVMVYYGQGLEGGDRVYAMDLWKQKQTLLHDFGETRFDGVDFGQGCSYDFISSRGDVINGFYVLPPDFDASKKYPLVVHYYGGCSPSTRYTVGSYSPQYYAAQGYVFYVINPSGATGFGQEFSSRHVNTAGDVVTDDIIEGTRRFCQDHPFVDASHVGCFSASYGGFMTQLLLTRTDIYATGISHAGISDHTSYWGEGYWGYSYSEVSMADSYPWNRKDLYVDRSPLYNADKIHTPLLFLHGSADTNVPIGESIQMFTALKLLGQDTAFVVVDGENHGIRDYAKRRQWLRTISAWFSKYLKEDPSWWDELYPPKTL